MDNVYVSTNLVDNLFQHALEVEDPLLPGQVQKVDLHIIRQRARHSLDDGRVSFVLHFCFFLSSVAMISNPHYTDEGAWETLSHIIIISAMVISSLEFFLYGLGHGVLPRGGANTKSIVEGSRIWSVLSVWSPPRLRQSGESAVVSQLMSQPPLLENRMLCGEILLVFLSIIGYMIPGGNAGNGMSRMRYLHGLRNLRLVTPLVKFIPSIRYMVTAFRGSLAMLASAATFLVFFFVIFGVMGVDQFQGQLSLRCVMIDPSLKPNYTAVNLGEACRGENRPLLDQCIEAYPPIFCDETATKISFGAPSVCYHPMVCRSVSAPNYGYTTFDNIFKAWVSMFQIASLSNWSDLMYGMWAGKPQLFVGLYCVLLIVIISFIVLNFVVAIIASSYAKARSAQKQTTQTNQRTKSSTFVVFAFEQLIWWNFSPNIVRHLTFVKRVREEDADGKEDDEGRTGTKRVPFFEHPRFKVFSAILLFAMVLVHSINGTHMSEAYDRGVRRAEVAYCIIFCVEIVFSVCACGSVGKYFLRDWSKFDGCCLVLCIIGASSGMPLSVVRSLAIIKGAQKIGFIRRSNLLAASLRACRPSLVVTSFLVVCIYVMAAVAVQLFSNRRTEIPQEDNFNTITLAVRSIFRLVTLDGWEKLLYQGMAEQTWFLGLIFFIPAYVLFGYMLSSLFTAVVLDTFEPRAEEKKIRQQKEYDRMHEQKEEKAKHDTKSDASDLNRTVNAPTLDPAQASPMHQEASMFVGRVTRVEKKVPDASFAIFSLKNKFRRWLMILAVDKYEIQVSGLATRAQLEDAPVTYGHIFQYIIIVFVIGSCLQVAVQPAGEACSSIVESQKSGTPAKVHFVFDVIFAVIFSVEMLIKMIAQGVAFPGDDRPVWLGPTYFRDAWNVLDFILLVFMFVSFGYAEAKALRLFRTLRPLRVIRRIENMRILASGIFAALPAVLVVWAFSIYLIFVFGTVGVGLWAGKMHHCNTGSSGGVDVFSKADCSGMYINPQGVLSPVVWQRPNNNFDHVGAATSFLVQIASLSGWNELMNQAIDIVGKDKQPQHQHSLQNSIFFFVFVIISAFFVLNIVIGILLVSLDEQRGLLFLTKHQRDWFTIRKEMLKLKPIVAPVDTYFPKVQKFVSQSLFDAVVNIAVILNVIVVATVHHNQSDAWTDVQFYSNLFFLVFFFIEMVLKLLAFGKDYFFDPWNLLDFLVVLGSGVEFSFHLASRNRDVAVSSVGRAIRILRIFRATRRNRNLRGLFHTLVHALPSIFSITGFLFILLFMYSVLAMGLFGHVRYQETLNKNANFRNPVLSWMTLFRMVTLDGWNLLMQDLKSYVHPVCSELQRGWWYYDLETGENKDCGFLDDCSTEWSQLYFYSFYSIGAYLFLNVVVAIMLDNFNYISTQTRIRIRIDHLDNYKECWKRARRAVGVKKNYDHHIEPHLLSAFIIDLFNEDNTLVRNEREKLNIHPVLTGRSRMNYKRMVYEIEMEARKQNLPPGMHCTFQNILLACARMQMGKDALTIQQRELREEYEEQRSLALVGKRIKTELIPVLMKIRARRARRKSEQLGLSSPKNSFHVGGASALEGNSESMTGELVSETEGLVEEKQNLRRVFRQNLRVDFQSETQLPEVQSEASTSEPPDSRQLVEKSTSDSVVPISDQVSGALANESSFRTIRSYTPGLSTETMEIDEQQHRKRLLQHQIEQWFMLSKTMSTMYFKVVIRPLIGHEKLNRRAIFTAWAESAEALARASLCYVEDEIFKTLRNNCRVSLWLYVASPNEKSTQAKNKSGPPAMDFDSPLVVEMDEILPPTTSLPVSPPPAASVTSMTHSKRRNPITTPTAPVRMPVNPIALEFASPMCLKDQYCTQYNDPIHRYQKRHTCRSGIDCDLIGDPEHNRLFLHPNVVFLE